MNSRISTEYVSIESRRDHELLIVIFWKFYKFPYSFLYYLDAIMDNMCKHSHHLVQYFYQGLKRNDLLKTLSSGNMIAIEAKYHARCLLS